MGGFYRNCYLFFRCAEGCVKYGLCHKSRLPAELHFNPDIDVLDILVTKNSYCDRSVFSIYKVKQELLA